MNSLDLIMTGLVVFLAFASGYVTRDYMRFSRQYDAHHRHRGVGK